MNFLDTPLSYTRSSRLSQTPAEYASSVERFVNPGPSFRSTVLFLGVVLLAVAAAAYLV